MRYVLWSVTTAVVVVFAMLASQGAGVSMDPLSPIQKVLQLSHDQSVDQNFGHGHEHGQRHQHQHQQGGTDRNGCDGQAGHCVPGVSGLMAGGPGQLIQLQAYMAPGLNYLLYAGVPMPPLVPPPESA